MSTEADDLWLNRRTRRLELDVQPERDLWPGIEAELNASAPPRASAWRRVVAPLALAASLLVGVALLFQPDVPTQPDSLGGVGTASTQPVAVDPGLMATRTRLLASLDAELARMSPESRVAVAQSLRDIDTALAAIRAELEHTPDNQLLADLLVSTYADQVILLGEMDGMARAIRSRTQL